MKSSLTIRFQYYHHSQVVNHPNFFSELISEQCFIKAYVVKKYICFLRDQYLSKFTHDCKVLVGNTTEETFEESLDIRRACTTIIHSS